MQTERIVIWVQMFFSGPCLLYNPVLMCLEVAMHLAYFVPSNIYIYIFALPVMVLNDLYIHAIYVTFCYILLDIPYIHILRVYTLTYTHRHMPHLFTLYIYICNSISIFTSADRVLNSRTRALMYSR